MADSLDERRPGPNLSVLLSNLSILAPVYADSTYIRQSISRTVRRRPLWTDMSGYTRMWAQATKNPGTSVATISCSRIANIISSAL